MDPVATTAALYGAETAAEGAVAAYFVTQPTLPLKARLRHVASKQPLPRSSHSLAVIGTSAHVFGGDISENQLASNAVETLELPTTEATVAEVRSAVPNAQPAGEDTSIPSPRRGHTAVSARNRMFVFGGQPGHHEQPLDEKGRLWVYDGQKKSWEHLDPPPGTEYPPARSHHCSTASEDGDAIFIHGGSTSANSTASPNSDGDLLADTWAFFLDKGKWIKLPNAPGPPRREASLAYAQGSLWRFGGFDGHTTLGGQLDYLEVIPPHTIDPSKEETLPSTTESDVSTEWKSLPFDFETKEAASKHVPERRSLCTLRHINTGQGRHYLLLGLGASNHNPTSAGNEKDAHYLQDIWAFQLPSSATTGAGIKDAIRETLPGTVNTKGQWAPVEIVGVEVGPDENEGGKWTGRAWFDADATGSKQFMIWGGVGDGNERLGDGWIVTIE